MKFIASYVYKDANGKDHTHRHLRKGTKMTDPVVVYIDGKEWKTFQSFTKAKQAAINHIKGMKESVEMNEKASHDEIMKDINDFLRNNDGSGLAGMSRRLEKKYGIGPAQARSMIKKALQKAKALPKTGPKRMGRFPHMNEETAIAHQTPYGTVTAHKRDTKGMRGKQDGFKLTLKTKSGKTVDLGSHPKPTKANVMSIVKNVMQKESVNEERLKVGDKVKTPQGTVEIIKYDTRGMRGKQDDYEMILTMRDGKKVSMGSHPQPTATAVTNIAKRHFSKGVPSYMKHMRKESVNENFRTLARAGMGTEKKGEARVGLEMDYYDGSGTKRMGKIIKVTPKGYIVKDDKDGKNRQFTFHDRAKAKEILARIGKGKYNEETKMKTFWEIRESVELKENKYPMASKWMQGVKSVKGKGFEFVRSRDGVHTIKKNGKAVGDFSLEMDSDLWVINLNGVRGQVTADSIDDIPKLISNKIKESVELDENSNMAAIRKLLGGTRPMDLERASNAIKSYAKKSGGIDKKDFDLAADYLAGMGRLNDLRKVADVKKKLTMHVGTLDTDVRDKIKSMLPNGLNI